MVKILNKYTENTQFVIFKVENIKYGIDIFNIQEINRVTEIFKTNSTPDYADGIINQRGKVVPIINLRRKFEIEKKDDDFSSRIILIDINNIMHGFLVDSIVGIIKLPIDTIRLPNQKYATKATKNIMGVADLENESIYILDGEKLLQ